MKFLAAQLMLLLTLSHASPLAEPPLSTRADGRLITETDRLLFRTPMREFQAARDAKKPPELIWDSNACTMSPDKVGDWDFKPSCQRHDFGYRNYMNQSRFTEKGKSEIDDNFKVDMDHECEKEDIMEAVACRAAALVYWSAVTIFGGKEPGS